LAIAYRRHYNPSSGMHFASYSCVYGYTRAITNAARLALGA
jgi:prolipoprotein diacylglyceryltransferase